MTARSSGGRSAQDSFIDRRPQHHRGEEAGASTIITSCPACGLAWKELPLLIPHVAPLLVEHIRTGGQARG
jgi:hypothetical protein